MESRQELLLGQRVLGGGSAGPRGAAARPGEHDGGIGARQPLQALFRYERTTICCLGPEERCQ